VLRRVAKTLPRTWDAEDRIHSNDVSLAGGGGRRHALRDHQARRWWEEAEGAQDARTRSNAALIAGQREYSGALEVSEAQGQHKRNTSGTRAEYKRNTSECHRISWLSIGWLHARYTPLAGKIFAPRAVALALTGHDAA